MARRQLEVLALLLQQKGRLVSKSDIINHVWQGAFVDQGSLTQAIFLLRRALGPMQDGSELIETVGRRGYRISPAAVDGRRPLAAIEAQTFRPDLLEIVSGSGEPDQFRLLVDSIEEYAIYMLDCTGRVLTWNAGAERNEGYRTEEILGKHYSLFFVPEDAEAGVPERELASAVRHGHTHGEGWRLRKNGERFWASFALTAMRSSSGKLLGFAKVVRDFTARKRFEETLLTANASLRKERDRLLAAAESSMDALYICEAVRSRNGDIEDFAFTYVNSNVETMFALERDVLLGGRLCELPPFNLTSGLFESYKQVISTGAPFVTEFAIQKSPSSCNWVRIRARRLGDGLAITASDITTLKALEHQAANLDLQSNNRSAAQITKAPRA